MTRDELRYKYEIYLIIHEDWCETQGVDDAPISFEEFLEDYGCEALFSNINLK
ncbi:hypothetical protein SAMN05446037_1006104 [Anaerovirgula multivorans]|uniref:Uncharacterized protein n=1 Tax=Anaerovirgula multivorans TaxID=312168 RepID=A0A239CSM2_9FIRM|nr:hypothetical protein [Anaerovirgula multivorans]SNS22514.1 hypothetical protein SAMN05446037_1006104 [Anaerovirgula multivorans]